MSTSVDTRARVVFVSHKYGRLDATPDLLHVTTTKNFHSPGSWNLTLVPHSRRTTPSNDRINWFKYLRSGDWVEIYMQSDLDGVEQIVMWGPVSEINRTRTASASGIQERIAVSGSDWVQALATFEVVFDQAFANYFELVPYMEAFNNNKFATKFMTAGETVIELLRSLTNFPKTSDQFVLPDSYGKRLIDFIHTALVNTQVGYGRTYIAPVINAVSLWEYLRVNSDPARNYLYGDLFYVENGYGPTGQAWAPHLVLDRYPYRPGELRRMTPAQGRMIELTDADVVTENLGRHDRDLANWFRVAPQLLGVNQAALMTFTGPIINKESIRRHGIRRFTADSLFTFPRKQVVPPFRPDTSVNNQTTDMTRIVKDYVEEVAVWYNNNEEAVSGHLETRLLPKARPVSYLTYENTRNGEGYEFFVEEVSHTWSYSPPHSATVLAVTRGEEVLGYTNKVWAANNKNLLNASIDNPGPVVLPEDDDLFNITKEVP